MLRLQIVSRGSLLFLCSFGLALSFAEAQAREIVLHSFAGGADGAHPQAGLLADAKGNLYGTTPLGGAFRQGTAFELDVAGNYTVLHSFSGPDGNTPVGGLVRDRASNLYGTAERNGGFGYGTVFEIIP